MNTEIKHCDCCEEIDKIALSVKGENICSFCLKTAIRWAEIDKKAVHTQIDEFVVGIKEREGVKQ